MKDRIRNIGIHISILLIIVWLAHSIYPVYYAISVLIEKEKQFELIESEKASDQYQSITIPLASFQKQYSSTEKELSIQGGLYDVVQYTIQNDSVICTLLADKDEAILHDNYISSFSHEKGVHNPKAAITWWPVAIIPTHSIPLSFYSLRSAPRCVCTAPPLHHGYLKTVIKPPCTA